MRRIDFSVLGPVEARDERGALALGGPRQRALLAVLLVHANEVVSVDRLLEAVWGERPPANGAAALHVRISQLRKVVGAERIQTRPSGYLLVTDAGELDLARFEWLVSAGREALAHGDPERAAALLGDAMDLWHGEALGGVQLGPVAATALAPLEELRRAALEWRIDAQLQLGRHETVVGELDTLIVEQPLRERLREHRMVALYRAGRQAEALAAYREMRQVWVRELGIEPSRRLQRLQHAILVQDPSLDPARPAGGSTGRLVDEERKVVTLLLADLVEDEDLERARSSLRRLREVVGAEAEAAGGTVETTLGGIILATFGAPAALEDHCSRALRVARSIAHQLSGILPFRIAVETGEIIVGRSGLTGPPLGEAMRLLSTGESGCVRIGERAAAAARLAPDNRRARQGALFVGRLAELEALHLCYRRALVEAAPQLVTLIGDAGVGKSRLAREFLAGVAGESPAPRCLTGRCVSYGRGITYRPFGEMLAELHGLRADDSPARILELLAGREILGLALGLDVAGELHPIEVAKRFRHAWVELFSTLVAERPGVLLLEDLHWAQGDLLDLVECLHQGVPGPLMIVATARPEVATTRPSWGRSRGATSVWLEPLTRHEAERLVAQAPADLREQVLARAEGNPFFIEELLAGISGGDLDPATVPDSVHAVLAARIDQLPPPEKAALQAASVIGRTFWPEPVRQLLGGASPDFGLLEERDFVRPRARSSFGGTRELAFKHALTREVAFASLPRGTRARLHAGFADWLHRFGNGRDEHASLLAHHYAQAVRSEDADLAWAEAAELDRLRIAAIDWTSRSATLAVGRYEIDDGIALLHRALELEQDPDALCRLWRALARASALKFDGQAFWTAMEAALNQAQDNPTRAEICSELAVEAFVRAGMWTKTPALERVGTWIARAIELAEPETASRARALVAKALRDLDDQGSAAEAARIAETLDDAELCIHAWDACGAVAMAAGDYEVAWRWRTRRLTLLDRVTDPDLRTIIGETPYSACVATCRFDQAREVARLHNDLAAALTPHHRVHGAAILVEVAELLGDWAAVRALQDHVRATVAANADTPCQRNARSLLVCALAAAHQGDEAAARQLERNADDLSLLPTPVLDAPRLRLALLRGDHVQAGRLLARIESDHGWYSRGHGTSLATLVVRLDAQPILGRGAAAEREATPHLGTGSYVEPFALRGLGLVRGDRELIHRALRRFTDLGLDWHAAQTRPLLQTRLSF